MGKLRQKVVKGAMWAYLERLSTQMASFVIGMVLSRLLTPTDYGTVALIGIFLSIAGVLASSGFGSALVQKKDATVFIPEDENAYDTVFADVPCSGLGIINRKPDIKYFFRKENLDSLISLQKEILKKLILMILIFMKE